MIGICSKVPGWKKNELLKQEIKERKGQLKFPANSKKWYDRAEDEKARKKFWAAPMDPRFPQTNRAKYWILMIFPNRYLII